MKRGFLNKKKARKGAMYPRDSSASAGVVATLASAVTATATKEIASKPADRQPVPEALIPKMPYGKVDNTALPAGFKPTELTLVASDCAKANHPANALLMTTIPTRFVGMPPDPDGHSEWLVFGPAKDKVTSAPGYPQPVPKFLNSVVVKSTLSMGQGVFATRDIKLGEIIFAERPLLVMPRSLFATTDAEVGAYEMEDLVKILLFKREQQLEVAVGRMEPDKRTKLMALMNSHSEDGSGPITGIVRTNGYELHLWDGDVEPEGKEDYTVVGDIGSRINHSCLPNVSHVFKISAFAMIFMATRDIKSGEQLFYLYCGHTQSAAERKAELAPYGIEQCICASCVDATPETDTIRKTFDARVEEYHEQSKIWVRHVRLPVGTLGEMLKFQRAVLKEGFGTSDSYWLVFMPALAIAFQAAGMPREAQATRQGILKWEKFWKEEKALGQSEP